MAWPWGADLGLGGSAPGSEIDDRLSFELSNSHRVGEALQTGMNHRRQQREESGVKSKGQGPCFELLLLALVSLSGRNRENDEWINTEPPTGYNLELIKKKKKKKRKYI